MTISVSDVIIFIILIWVIYAQARQGRAMVERCEELERRVLKIESMKVGGSDQSLNSSVGAFNLFLGSLVAFLIYSGIETYASGDEVALYDYLAYISPVLAGAIAGFGLYTKKNHVSGGGVKNWDAVFYRYSVAFLALGIFSYLASKGRYLYFIAIVAGVAGVIMTLYAVWINGHSAARIPVKRMQHVYIFIVLFFGGACFVVGVVWILSVTDLMKWVPI